MPFFIHFSCCTTFSTRILFYWFLDNTIHRHFSSQRVYTINFPSRSFVSCCWKCWYGFYTLIWHKYIADSLGERIQLSSATFNLYFGAFLGLLLLLNHSASYSCFWFGLIGIVPLSRGNLPVNMTHKFLTTVPTLARPRAQESLASNFLKPSPTGRGFVDLFSYLKDVKKSSRCLRALKEIFSKVART